MCRIKWDIKFLAELKMQRKVHKEKLHKATVEAVRNYEEIKRECLPDRFQSGLSVFSIQGKSVNVHKIQPKEIKIRKIANMRTFYQNNMARPKINRGISQGPVLQIIGQRKMQ